MSRTGHYLAGVVSIFLILALAPHSAHACTVGTGNQEEDFAQALTASDEVFVANLLSFQEAPPPAGVGIYYLNQINYGLVEIIKGRPDLSGTLSESNPYHPIDGQPPGPSCGPFLLYPDSVGAAAVVFVSRSRVDGKPYLWVNPYSRRLVAGDPDSKAMLDLIRKLQLEKEAKK